MGVIVKLFELRRFFSSLSILSSSSSTDGSYRLPQNDSSDSRNNNSDRKGVYTGWLDSRGEDDKKRDMAVAGVEVANKEKRQQIVNRSQTSQQGAQSCRC